MSTFDSGLFRAVPSARAPVVWLALFSGIQGVSTIAAAFALGALVSAVVSGSPLYSPLGWVVAVFTLRAAGAYATEAAAARAGTRVSTDLRRRLLGRRLTQPVDTAADPAGALTFAAQGVTSVETYVVRFLPAVVTACAVPTLAVVALLAVDWPSALIVLATLPLLPVFAWLIGRTTREVTDRRWAALRVLAGHFLDVVQGLPTLVAYGRAERQVAAIRATSERHRVESMATLRMAFLSSAALELLATISVALVAVSVGLRLVNGDLDLRTGLVAILLAPEAYWPIRRVGAEFHAAADGAQALRQILSDLQRPASGSLHETRRTPTKDRVSVAHIVFRYPGSADEVLSDVSLSAGRGLTVITGPTGSGKTTLLEVLAGLRQPESGTVETAPAHLVAQRPFLLPDTVRVNLTAGSGLAATTDDLWSALDRVGMRAVVATMPAGLETRLGDDGFGLSAGQRGRLALARALLSPAGVVLLDEPTAHLDTDGVSLAHRVIATLARERVVVATTHRPELVRLAEQHVSLACRTVARHTEAQGVVHAAGAAS